jgi:hypothetical protein
VGVDFLPFVGTSSLTGMSSVRRFSFNVLGGVSAGLQGFELGGLFNVESRFTCGVAIAGLMNLTLGPVRGAQLSGIVNAGRELRGVQAGLINVSVGESRGVQLGLVDVASRSFSGAQMGLIDVSAGDLRGTQIGLVNVATKATVGAQVGLVNVSGGPVRGAQIGLVNVAERCTFCLGLINVIRRGRLHVDVWGQESGLIMAGLKHGGDYFHTIYGVGVEPFHGNPRMAFALGIGGHAPLSARFFLDIDVIAYSLHDVPSFNPSATLSQSRAVLGVRAVERLAIYAGPTFNVMNRWQARAPSLSPYRPSFQIGSGTADSIEGWPGVTVGIQGL